MESHLQNFNSHHKVRGIWIEQDFYVVLEDVLRGLFRSKRQALSHWNGIKSSETDISENCFQYNTGGSNAYLAPLSELDVIIYEVCSSRICESVSEWIDAAQQCAIECVENGLDKNDDDYVELIDTFSASKSKNDRIFKDDEWENFVTTRKRKRAQVEKDSQREEDSQREPLWGEDADWQSVKEYVDLSCKIISALNDTVQNNNGAYNMQYTAKTMLHNQVLCLSQYVPLCGPTPARQLYPRVTANNPRVTISDRLRRYSLDPETVTTNQMWEIGKEAARLYRHVYGKPPLVKYTMTNATNTPTNCYTRSEAPHTIDPAIKKVLL